MIASSVLSTLLALAATFLGLSLLVQVTQEVYKFLTSSKARSFERVLVDFLGPHALQLKRPGNLPDLQTRGPFQFLRRRPTGRLQPMDETTLVNALERAAAPWITRAVEAVHLEVEIQKGAPASPSPAFRQLLGELAAVEPGSPGYFTATEVSAFLNRWLESQEMMDAEALLAGLRQRFLPAVGQVRQHFSQFTKNLEYAYRRRNLRQTFLFGFGIAFLFHLPVQRLYQRAAAVPLEEAVAAAERLQAIYAAQPGDTTAAPRELEELRALAESIRVAMPVRTVPDTFSFAAARASLRAEFPNVGLGLYYLFGCLVTSLLISFGAPFWNDLSGALLQHARGSSPRPKPSDEPGT